MSKDTKLPELTYNRESGKILVRESLLEIIFPHGSTVIHKKTGKKYFYCKVLINATNDNDGQVMVLYKNEYRQFFVREINEFCEKFLADLSETLI